MAPDYYLSIKYDIHRPTHSGYCSDPGEEEFEDEEEYHNIKITSELWKNLRDYVDPETSIVSLSYFDYHNRYEEIRCQKGSGYCGYKGYRRIAYAKVTRSLFKEIDAIFK